MNPLDGTSEELFPTEELFLSSKDELLDNYSSFRFLLNSD
jgi:hypothetical protein